MAQQSILLETELIDDLNSHLELIARGGLPSPEIGAQLLRRFKSAVAESRRGFTPSEPPDMLKDAPPMR